MDVFHLIAFVLGVLLLSKFDEEPAIVGFILCCWAWGAF
jgi:hypothetical protein